MKREHVIGRRREIQPCSYFDAVPRDLRRRTQVP